ncbi:hypothetical protein JJB07_05390 [Tumebacillus sp. ITR2]|uniref:Uncharacterized protein n=1 Tax=Tumebacillus amylolyticus TaxID=2801339 RepID=A0ABS1J719_9BACL|nr:CBO0543 family protein [Tumebacillus amylolyticus]MBL0386082.1 hypothetical protein [Tumebacillus amylolyticus]
MGEWAKSGLVLLTSVSWLVAYWIFGDHKRWREYYATALFICMWDFISTILTFHYGLWRFERTMISPSHVQADFSIVFTHLLPMGMLIPARYPYKSGWWKQGWFLLFFLAVNSGLEAIFHAAHLISYYHGWNYAWSVALWGMMILAIRIHYTHPIWAWVFNIAMTAFIIWHFKIPIPSLT